MIDRLTPKPGITADDWMPSSPKRGWQSASQVLSLEGYHRSETEDGRVIESTVDPT